MDETRNYKYDVAISFAEEDRNAALALALAFELKGLKQVFYYPQKQEEIIGELLKEKLIKIYSQEAAYAIILFSESYLNNKPFPKLEFDAIRERMRQQTGVYLIPVKLSEMDLVNKLPELSERQFLNWDFNPKKIVRLLSKRFNKKKVNSYKKSFTMNQANNANGNGINKLENKVSFKY